MHSYRSGYMFTGPCTQSCTDCKIFESADKCAYFPDRYQLSIDIMVKNFDFADATSIFLCHCYSDQTQVRKCSAMCYSWCPDEAERGWFDRIRQVSPMCILNNTMVQMGPQVSAMPTSGILIGSVAFARLTGVYNSYADTDHRTCDVLCRLMPPHVCDTCDTCDAA